MSITYPDLNTAFPESIDTFTQWLDITASDGPLIKQYTEAMQEGNVALANQILTRIPNATQKIIKATDLNKLTQAMLALERFYKSDVQDYVNAKQNEWQSIIDQFSYIDVWSSGRSYLKANMVLYTVFGNDHIFIATGNVPVGTVPTDDRYWRQLTVRGKQGLSGAGLTYRYQWSAGVSYVENDAVTYDGALWMAAKPSQAVTPVKGSPSWRLIMTLASVAYPIQDTEPTNQSAGDLWFNTSGNPTRFYFLDTLQNPASSNDIAVGKQAYDQEGNLIIGTGTGVASDATWNGPSTLNWN